MFTLITKIQLRTNPLTTPNNYTCLILPSYVMMSLPQLSCSEFGH